MKSAIIVLVILISTPVFAFQIPSKSEEPNVSVKKIFYDDGVLAWEKFYNQNKKLDSSKTYYKSGELDELFFYKKGVFHGKSFRLDRLGDTITSWNFSRGKLIERKDHQIIFTEKTENKVRERLKSLVAFNKSIKLNPDDVKSIYNRSGARLYLGNRTLALRDLEKVKGRFDKAANPDKIPIKILGGLYDRFGSIYSSFEMEDHAIHYKFKALKASPEESRLYHNLGSYLITIKQYRAGIVFLNTPIAMVPGHSFANWISAIAYTDMGDYTKAMECVTIAFKSEESLYKRGDGTAERDLYTTRGFLHHKLGNTETGIIDLQKALEINSNNSFALKNLGIIYLDLEKYEDACIAFTKAASLGYEKIHDSDDLEPLLNLACNPENSLFALKTSLEEAPYVYPNPVKNTINIKNFEYSNFDYKIYSFDSRLIKQGNSNASGIDISELSSGLYILNFEKEGIRYAFKIIKN